MPRRRIVFMGSPGFAIPALDRLAESHDIVAVYSQPPRRAGRGMQEQPQPVAAHAATHDIPTFHPQSLSGQDDLAILEGHDADLFVVVAYGLLLPRAVLDMPRFGCINGHASLLPRWRGAAPIQRAIAAGDTETGVCAMLMEEGLDTGPVLARRSTPISDDDDAGSLHDRLASLNADLLADVAARLPDILDDAAPQDDSAATYAHKISSTEAVIDWSRPADQLARHIRAFAPAPAAWFTGHRGRVRVLKAHAAPETGTGTGPAGCYLGSTDDGGLQVGTADGVLVLETVQPAGSKPMPAQAFLNGARLVVGQPMAPDLPEDV
jgi:methionyl-tRNA formyltransferase